MSILLEEVTRTYATDSVEVHALRGVSLEVRANEYVALMGPSGSGKSTLMNLIGCLDTPTSGSYHLDGEDVSDLVARSSTRRPKPASRCAIARTC